MMELGPHPLALVASVDQAPVDFLRPRQHIPLSFIINEPQCVFRQIFESTLRQRGITMENTIELWSLRPSRRESNQSGDAGIHAVYAGGTRGALKFGDENDESLNHC